MFAAQEGETLTTEEGVVETEALIDWEPEAAENETGGEDYAGGDFAEPSEDAKLFVGNLPYDVDSEKLAMLFEPAGTVEIAEVSLFNFNYFQFSIGCVLVVLLSVCGEMKLSYGCCCFRLFITGKLTRVAALDL